MKVRVSGDIVRRFILNFLRRLIRNPLSEESGNQSQTRLFSYDFFISHAREDKKEFVNGLAKTIQARGYSIWYDKYELTVGSTVHEEINRGLTSSRVGLVVLSRHYFSPHKTWAKRELGGMMALEHHNRIRIAAVCHGISKDEVEREQPLLASSIFISTDDYNTEKIVDLLIEFLGKSEPEKNSPAEEA